MIFLNNNRMYFPGISIAIPENIFMETEPKVVGEYGIEFVSINPSFKIVINYYDSDIEKNIKYYFGNFKIEVFKKFQVNGIVGFYAKYISRGLNYGEIILDIKNKNTFSLYIETKEDINMIFENENIKNLINSIQLLNKNQA